MTTKPSPNWYSRPVWVTIGIFALIFSVTVGLMYYFHRKNSGSVTRKSTFGKCLGFDDENDWSVLARPNSLWRPGVAMEFPAENKPPRLLGDFMAQCLPGMDVKQATGVTAHTGCDSELDYSLSLSTMLGLSDHDLESLGLGANDAGESSFVTRVRIDKAQEISTDLLQIENYLTKERFESMPLGCKRTLTDGSRFIVAGVYEISAGSIRILGLSRVVNDALGDAAQPDKVTGRSRIIFVDTDVYPNSYQIVGPYHEESGQIVVQLTLRGPDNSVRAKREVKGNSQQNRALIAQETRALAGLIH